MKESIKRLKVAFDSDSYVKQLRQKMQDVLAYSAIPFDNKPPEEFDFYKQVLESYTKDWWGSLLPNPERLKSDLAMAMGMALMADHQSKLLKTKHNSGLSVLEAINVRLDLYLYYQRYWLATKNWIIPAWYLKFKDVNFDKGLMSFTEWLYIQGYESLLTDREFLNAIRYFDEQ